MRRGTASCAGPVVQFLAGSWNVGGLRRSGRAGSLLAERATAGFRGARRLWTSKSFRRCDAARKIMPPCHWLNVAPRPRLQHGPSRHRPVLQGFEGEKAGGGSSFVHQPAFVKSTHPCPLSLLHRPVSESSFCRLLNADALRSTTPHHTRHHPPQLQPALLDSVPCNCCISRIPAPIVPAFPSRQEPDSSSLSRLLVRPPEPRPSLAPIPRALDDHLPPLRLLAPPMIHAPTTASRLPRMAGADAW